MHLRCLVLEELIAAWRASQQRVNELERQYADAMLAYSRGEGPEPPEEAHAEFVAQRKDTKELLTRAMKEIDRRMKDIDRHRGGV